MSRLFLVPSLVAILLSCGGIQELEPDLGPGTSIRGELDHTEVIVLGTLHRSHLDSEGFGLAVIEAFVRQVDPDVVLVEIPPDRFDAIVSEVDELGPGASEDTLTDGWIQAFPELYGVVLPLRHELGYEVVPVSGWTPEVSADRNAYWESHPAGPVEREYILSFHRFQTSQLENDVWENPRWANGDEYVLLSGTVSRWLSYFAEEELGAAGEMRINSRHAALISDAIVAHPNRRILVVYGARHRYFIEPTIDVMPNVERLDPLDYLP